MTFHGLSVAITGAAGGVGAALIARLTDARLALIDKRPEVEEIAEEDGEYQKLCQGRASP